MTRGSVAAKSVQSRKSLFSSKRSRTQSKRSNKVPKTKAADKERRRTENSNANVRSKAPKMSSAKSTVQRPSHYLAIEQRFGTIQQGYESPVGQFQNDEQQHDAMGIRQGDYLLIAATVVKKSQGTKTGISFRRVADTGQFFVLKISAQGLFAKTGLRVGDEIISINNIECTGKTVTDIEKQVLPAKGPLTLVVKRDAPRPSWRDKIFDLMTNRVLRPACCGSLWLEDVNDLLSINRREHTGVKRGKVDPPMMMKEWNMSSSTVFKARQTQMSSATTAKNKLAGIEVRLPHESPFRDSRADRSGKDSEEAGKRRLPDPTQTAQKAVLARDACQRSSKSERRSQQSTKQRFEGLWSSLRKKVIPQNPKQRKSELMLCHEICGRPAPSPRNNVPQVLRVPVRENTRNAGKPPNADPSKFHNASAFCVALDDILFVEKDPNCCSLLDVVEFDDETLDDSTLDDLTFGSSLVETVENDTIMTEDDISLLFGQAEF